MRHDGLASLFTDAKRFPSVMEAYAAARQLMELPGRYASFKLEAVQELGHPERFVVLMDPGHGMLSRYLGRRW